MKFDIYIYKYRNNYNIEKIKWNLILFPIASILVNKLYDFYYLFTNYTSYIDGYICIKLSDKNTICGTYYYDRINKNYKYIIYYVGNGYKGEIFKNEILDERAKYKILHKISYY